MVYDYTIMHNTLEFSVHLFGEGGGYKGYALKYFYEASILCGGIWGNPLGTFGVLGTSLLTVVTADLQGPSVNQKYLGSD